MTRVAVVCPGRGSYTEHTRGRLPAAHPWVQRVDELRSAAGLESLSSLDHSPDFDRERHLEPVNVSALIWLSSLVQGHAVAEREDCVAVLGNSMGWYTALALSEVLDVDQGLQLVQEMARLQEERRSGGQVLYPEVGDDWRPSAERRAQVQRVLTEAQGQVFRSIHLGGYAVLAGTEEGVEFLTSQLPEVQLGRTRYPLRIPGHGPFHTPLVAPVAARAREVLGELTWRRPRWTLVDGLGRRHTPWSADPTALRDYTLGVQVTETFDLTTALRVTLRELAPERLVLPGPGNSLGGVCGQVLVAEGWRGIRDREGFERIQGGAAPVVDSLDR